MKLISERSRDLENNTASVDADLQQRVCRYLLHSAHLPVRSIGVSVCGGIVTLRGNVPTYHARQIAVACAQRVAGARQIIDEIQTDLPAPAGLCVHGKP